MYWFLLFFKIHKYLEWQFALHPYSWLAYTMAGNGPQVALSLSPGEKALLSSEIPNTKSSVETNDLKHWGVCPQMLPEITIKSYSSVISAPGTFFFSEYHFIVPTDLFISKSPQQQDWCPEARRVKTPSVRLSAKPASRKQLLKHGVFNFWVVSSHLRPQFPQSLQNGMRFKVFHGNLSYFLLTYDFLKNYFTSNRAH